MNEQGQLQYAGSVDDLKENPDFKWLLGDSAAKANKRSKAGIAKNKRKSEPSTNSASDAVAAAELTGALQTDAARQMGDSAVYKFYLESAGWPTIIAFTIGIIVFAFCDSFPSKSQSLEFEFLICLLIILTQASGSNGGLKRMKRIPTLTLGNGLVSIPSFRLGLLPRAYSPVGKKS